VAKKKSKSKTSSEEKIDGFGPKEKANVRKAIRLVWTRSYSKQLVVKRCTGSDGFLYCEQCKERTPKIEVNHKVTVGDVDDGFLRRLFVPSTEMEGLCKKCHAPITNKERREATAKKKAKKEEVMTDSYPHLDMKFDSDIEQMDLYTHEKVKLQEKRNKERAESVNLDELIFEGLTPKQEEFSIDSLI
jgi:hypothetical protein